jgi:hypothetical protein
MKTLQNNFTTPEQSRKLLELGIPDWTADCYFYEEGSIADDSTPQVVPFGEPYEDSSTETMFSSYISLPCWSVGRLVEIFLLCTPYRDIALDKSDLIEEMIFSLFLAKIDRLLDFSKLEE